MPEATTTERSESADVRVVVIDDHEVVRAGLEVLLRPPYRVVASVGTIADAVAAVEEHQPHVVLLDARLQGESGIDAIEPVRRAWPHARVVVLSAYEDAAWARAAIDAGARGYLVKDADGLDLVRNLDRVLGGGLAVDARVAAAVLDPAAHLLTPRERTIVRLISQGMTNRDIADELHLSAHTVKEYVSTVLHKLEAPTRAAAVSRAIALGILGDEPPPV